MFLVKFEDLDAVDGLTAMYGGKTYVKASSYPKAKRSQALADARKNLDLGVICLIVDADTDLSLWQIRTAIAFELSAELKQEIILLVNDLIGPIGAIVVERALPGVNSMKELGLRLEQKLPESARPQLRQYFAARANS
ncbi:MAG: hypothetical protein SFT94_02360 [Pseudanabaenaceae cyanobacterium bins.68]|nr:hypothetical protein [Pseudanabaenaceae cyanobacterium bins.68]